MSRKLKTGRLSLRQRILFLTTLTTGIGLVLASAGYLAYDIRTAREQKLQQLELAADLIATNAAVSFVFDDPSSAEKYLAALKARPGFRGGAYIRWMEKFWPRTRRRMPSISPRRIKQQTVRSGSRIA